MRLCSVFNQKNVSDPSIAGLELLELLSNAPIKDTGTERL